MRHTRQVLVAAPEAVSFPKEQIPWADPHTDAQAHQGKKILVVTGWLRELGIEPLALGVTKGGHPKHSPDVAYSAELVPFMDR